jgi:hypothetical protein
MDIFGYYFTIAFPFKLLNLSKTYNSKLITKGTNISSKRMCDLNSVKRKFSLSREAQAYIKIPCHIQNRTEGRKKKEIMIGISKREQTKKKKQKKKWELINTQVGKCSSLDKEVELKQKQA